MKVLAIANHKGGVGKTATVRALGDILSRNKRVLMVDLDPQSSLTASCGIQETDQNITAAFGGSQPGTEPLIKVIHQVSDNLYLAASSLDMAAVELSINSRLGREKILAKLLEPVEKDFDLVLIDCAPSLSLLVVNALTAADAVLIPCQPLPVDVAALRLFLETVKTINEINPRLSVLGILPTFYDPRVLAHQGAIEAMNNAGWPVLPVAIGKNIRIAEAGALGQSVIEYDPQNKQVENFEKLGELIKKWIEKTS